MTTNVAVPTLSSKVDPEVKRAITALVQHQEAVLNGSVVVGAAATAAGIGGSGTADTVGVLTQVTSLQAIGLFNSIAISWADSQSRSKVAGYELFRATVSDLGTAVRIAYTASKGYVDTPSNTSTSIQYFYWVRPVGKDDTTGPFAGPVNATTANDPTYILEILTGKVTESQLLEALKSRIDLIDTPTTGLIDSLLAEITARADADTVMAAQINTLSVGTGEQFDTFLIWYFDIGLEGWTGNGSPAATAGWIKQADHATDPYLISPVGLGVDATAYPRLRLRYKKAGTISWEGRIWWKRTTDSTWDVARSLVVTESSYDTDLVGNISTDMGWDGTIDQIRIDLLSTQNATDYTEIDWAAVGRASPGASVSSITTEQTVRANADISLAADISSLTTTVNGNTAALTTESAARTTADDALALDITNITATVNGNTSTISSESTTRASADSAMASDITTLQSTTGDNAAAIQTEENARVSGDSALSSSIATVQTSVEGNTASIQTQKTSTDGLSLQYTVKLDNNGFVSGFGLASTNVNDVPFSEFYAQADRFAIMNPAVAPRVITSITRVDTTATVTCTAHGFLSGASHVITGAAQGEYNGVKLVTVVDADTFTFQVVTTAVTPATVATGQANIMVSGSEAKVPFIVQDGVVYMDVAMIKDATIDNAKIANLTADKILSGTLTAGQSIIVAAGGSTVDSDYAELTEGDINFYAYLDGAHRLLKNLKNQQFFTASDGETVTLQYFTGQPEIMLYPASLQVSNGTYYTQDQTLELGNTVPVETAPGSGVWTFTVSAKLILSSSSVDAAVTWSTSVGSTILGLVWEYSSPSASHTTVASTAVINVTGTLSASGAGDDGYHTATLQISLDNGSTYQDIASYAALPSGTQSFSVDVNVSPGTYTWKYRLKFLGNNVGDSGSVDVTSTRYTTSGGILSVAGTVNGLAIR